MAKSLPSLLTHTRRTHDKKDTRTGRGDASRISIMTLQAQNDAFRQALFTKLDAPKRELQGMYNVTRGVHHLPPDAKLRILHAVRNYNDFTKDNDPYGEHDFGVIQLPNLPKVYWRIAYYEDATMQWGAEAPAEKCFRVLTILLADEQ